MDKVHDQNNVLVKDISHKLHSKLKLQSKPCGVIFIQSLNFIQRQSFALSKWLSLWTFHIVGENGFLSKIVTKVHDQNNVVFKEISHKFHSKLKIHSRLYGGSNSLCQMAFSPDISHKEFKRALQRPTILPLMKNTSSPGKCSLEIQHILLAHNELYSCPCSDRASVLLWTLCPCLVLSTKNQSLLSNSTVLLKRRVSTQKHKETMHKWRK